VLTDATMWFLIQRVGDVLTVDYTDGVFSIVFAIANAVTAFSPSHLDAEDVYIIEELYETRMNKTDSVRITQWGAFP
jgi:hypothetical protein